MSLFGKLRSIAVPVVALCWIRGTFASRLAATIDFEGQNEQPIEEVDFGFMTTDMRYIEHEKGFFDNANEWLFSDRAVSEDVKDEIVRGHYCQERGSRETTYYASSYCYWLPHLTPSQDARGDLPKVMQWYSPHESGYRAVVKTLRGAASGKCLKSSVCHDNGRSEGGIASASRYMTTLALPDDCLTEVAIRDRCLNEYQDSAKDLLSEKRDCQDVETGYTSASGSLNKCLYALKSLPQKIEYEIPHALRVQEGVIETRLWSWQQAQRDEEHSKMTRQSECYLTGITYHCWRPTRPSPRDKSLAQLQMEEMQYQQELSRYNMCERCRHAALAHDRAEARTHSTHVAYVSAKARIGQLHKERADAIQELQRWKDQKESLQRRSDAAWEKWAPRKDECERIYAEYESGEKTSMAACVPPLYNVSCERACVEQVAPESGCAVIEGAQQGSATGGGHLEVPCAPPAPSWILSYGDKNENLDDQCARIQQFQQPRYAQRVLKAGWLWKDGTGVNGWDKRFFVLEGSDQVRSAVLRYWDKDPSLSASAAESVDKAIIIWDAKSVKAKKGSKYGFKNGEQCFKFYHFYRKYRFCVPSDDGTDKSDERNEWMRLLTEEMRFAGAVSGR